MTIRWALLTGEYPPDPGGVSDYSRLIARGLAQAGDTVRVFAPPGKAQAESVDASVCVHRLPGCFGLRSLGQLHRALERNPRPDRILVQYVPHAFGFKAMNLPFTTWVASRLRQVAPIWVMFHEVASPLRKWPPGPALIGMVNRLMARQVAVAAERVFVAIPAWSSLLKGIAPRAKPAEWLPVPCGVATGANPVAVDAVRARFAPSGGFLVGHFGTYGAHIVSLLGPVTAELLKLVPSTALMLIGRKSADFRDGFVKVHRELAPRVHASGELSAAEVSAHLRACDLLIQPYPDGISTRRTTAMAALANGVPIVTNVGSLSETLWPGNAVAATSSLNPLEIARLAADLLYDRRTRLELARRGEVLYDRAFSIDRIIARLRKGDR